MKTTMLRAMLIGMLIAEAGVTITMAPTALAAGPLPTIGSEEAPYRTTGVINHINLSNDTVIVNDRGLNIAAGTPVHVGNQTRSRNVLHKGMRIGYKAVPVQGSRLAITEIWVLSGR